MRSTVPAVAFALIWWATFAFAQTIPPPSAPSSAAPSSQPAPQGATDPSDQSHSAVSPLVVQAKRPDYQRLVDRKSYALKSDLRAGAGSIADALRDIPSVQVDPEGTISLRGNADVTVLVDGQPSPLFQGPIKSSSLLSLPAGKFERVEVMTSPSAAFGAEGSGGIINLITRKGRPNTESASVTASMNSIGGSHATMSGSYGADKLTVTAMANFRRYVSFDNSNAQENVTDPTSGANASIAQSLDTRRVSTNWNAETDLGYELDNTTHIDADLSHYEAGARVSAEGLYQSNAAAGPLAMDYSNQGGRQAGGLGTSVSSTFTRIFSGEDHNFVINGSYSDSRYDVATFKELNYSIPPDYGFFQYDDSSDDSQVAHAKIEYKGPVDADAIDVGYEANIDNEGLSRDGRSGMSSVTAAPDSTLSDAFQFQQTIQAAFGTYERKWGALDALVGLRAEETDYSVRSAMAGLVMSRSYLSWFPDFHVFYTLTPEQDFSFEYSRRIARPDAVELDPFEIRNTPLSFSEGNPALAPALTDSAEFEYDYNAKPISVSADLFLRDTDHLITSEMQNLGEGAILTTYQNLGRAEDSGLEVVLNSPSAGNVSLSVSGDILWRELTQIGSEYGQNRAGLVSWGQARINWNATKNDFFQFSLGANGREVTAQGYVTSHGYFDLGYRHLVNDRLSVELIVVDPLDLSKAYSVAQAPGLRTTTFDDYRDSSVSIGFIYAFGGTRKSDHTNNFDFGPTGREAH